MPKCRMCRRELKDQESIKRGFGPICYKKYLIEKSKYNKDQISLFPDEEKINKK